MGQVLGREELGGHVPLHTYSPVSSSCCYYLFLLKAIQGS